MHGDRESEICAGGERTERGDEKTVAISWGQKGRTEKKTLIMRKS